ncbi:MAG: TRAP transporter substrate-binding protein DctP [Alphaproteobacteria bacterium]|nr:TRAP transporter substrate-binding protein DctP [Alphaproteobacteria bacterium]
MLRAGLVLVVSAAMLFGGGLQAQVVLKAAHAGPDGHQPFQMGMTSFLYEVEDATGGTLKIEIHPESRLGDERSVLKAVQAGRIAIALTSNAVLSEVVPELRVFDLPFLFRSRDHAYKVLDGPVGQSFAPLLEAKDLVLLGFYVAGVRNIVTGGRPAESPGDVKGLKAGVIPGSIDLDVFQALGASPIPMPDSQVRAALKDKTIDAAAPFDAAYDNDKLYEVAPYESLVEWQVVVVPLVMSKKIFGGLSSDWQKALRKSATTSISIERGMLQAYDDVWRKRLQIAGVKMSTPDRKPWIEAVQPVLRSWVPKVGEKILADIAATN